MLKKLFFVFALPVLSFAQTGVLENSGFAPGNLWFSKNPDTVGETITVYTLIWNASKDDISGTVSFFDNDSVIEEKAFVLPAGGSSKVLSVPWKVTDGYHKIYAQVTKSVSGPRGKTASAVSLEYNRTEEEEKFVSAEKAKSGATTTAKNFLTEKVEFAKEYIENNVPAPVAEASRTTASTTESVRELARNWSEEKVVSLKNNLESMKDSESVSSGWFGAERPLKYVALFILSALTYIFSNKLLFYGLLALVLFYMIRFIKRKFFF